LGWVGKRIIARNRHCERSEATSSLLGAQRRSKLTKQTSHNTRAAGRPQPTLYQHGGEAELAERVFAEDCFASLAMTKPLNGEPSQWRTIAMTILSNNEPAQ
jgi:hypothetical protein